MLAFKYMDDKITSGILCGRYIVKFRDQRVLRKHELDAFLCTAVSPHLHDTEMMQEMKVSASSP